MNNDWTIKKLFEEICRIEVEYKLFEKEINGVHFWKLIRFPLFIELTKKLNLYQEAHPLPPQSGNRYIRILKRLIRGTSSSLMVGSQDSKIILFPSGRKVISDSRLIDIYSYHLEDKWQENGINYLAIEEPYNGKFMRKVSKIVRHDEPLTFFSLWNYFKLKKDINMDFKTIEIDSIANIPIDKIKTLSKEYISNEINNFIRKYYYYNKIFSKYSPEKLYIVNAYSRNALLSAANDLEIETIEIQHGTISSFHIGYSYPPEVKVPYLPSKMELWGKFWYDISQLPIKKKNISYNGFPFLHEEIEKYSDIARDETRVLFVSQGTIGKSLVNMALEFANKYKEYKVVYRLHPSEVDEWKSLYPELYSFSMENSNMVIETGIVTPLYKSFAESKFVVGVYSTALIESLAANCKLILIDLPGVEYFQDLIDKNLVKKVKSVDQLKRALKENDESTIIDNHYFFTKHREAN